MHTKLLLTLLCLAPFATSCGILLGDAEDLSSGSVASVTYEDQMLKVKGKYLDKISGATLKSASATKALTVFQKSSSEVIFKASTAGAFTFTPPVTLTLNNSSGNVTVALSINIEDGAIAISKLEPGATNSVLTTNASSQVEWSQNPTLSSLQIDPTASNLTGSLASIKGSVITGSGTQFSSELQSGDTLLIGGTPIKISSVVSDTKIVAADLTYPTEVTTHGPARAGNYIFIDGRDADGTTLSTTVSLPKYGGIYRGLVIYSFARAAAMPTLTVTANGATSTDDEDSFRTSGDSYKLLYTAFAGTSGFADGVNSVDIVMTSSESGRLAMLIVPVTGINGTISSGGGSHGSLTSISYMYMFGSTTGTFTSNVYMTPSAITLQPDVATASTEACSMPFMVKALGANDFSIAVIKPRPDASGQIICAYDITGGGPTALFAWQRAEFAGNLSVPLQRIRGYYQP